MPLLLPLGPRGRHSWSLLGGGREDQKFLCRALLRLRVPTWVSVERRVTPSPGNCATCLCVLTLLGYGWEWVRLAQHSLVCGCLFPHLQVEGCCGAKWSAWHSKLVPHTLFTCSFSSHFLAVWPWASHFTLLCLLCPPQKGTIKGVTSVHGHQDEVRTSMVSSLRSALKL